MQNTITPKIAGRLNSNLGKAETMIRAEINYLRKNECFDKAQELQEALIALNAIDVEAKPTTTGGQS